MSDYQNFTSLPPEQERDFIIYEKTSVESGQKAWRIALIISITFGILVVGVVLGVGGKPHNKMADDDMGMLKRADSKKDKAEKAAAKPDKPASETSGAAADKPDEAGGSADGDKDKGEAADGDEGEDE